METQVGDKSMRDIRGDLQERSDRIAEQISATQAQLDKTIEQLKLEHQGKLEDLKSDLNAVRQVMRTEDRLGTGMSPSNQSEPRVLQRPQQAHSQQAASDSLMRKVSALR
jgi:hypothetical protein